MESNVIVVEFLEIFKDGIISRLTNNKNKKLNYSVDMLTKFFDSKGLKKVDVTKFINLCNKTIDEDRNYLVVGKLGIQNNFIINIL